MAENDNIPPVSHPYKIDFDSDPSPDPPQSSSPGLLAQFKLAPATPAIIGMNFLVFFAMVATTGGEAFLHPTGKTLVDWGANYGPLTFMNGEYWRVLTNVFVHIGIVHICMNMYVLWDVGSVLERLYGSGKFVLIYLLAGIGGSLVSLFFNPTIVSAGASGAVFGAFGALLAIFKGRQQMFDRNFLQSAMRAVGFLLVFNLIWGFSQRGIDNAAHIGGFVTGVVVGFALLPGQPGDKRWSLQNVVWFILLTVAMCAAAYAEYTLFARQLAR